MSSIHGGCLCGACRFEIDLPVLRAVHCHCEDCRRASSAAFMTFVGVEDGQWRRTGLEPSIYSSKPGVERGFCGTCSSPLSFRSTHLMDKMHFPLAAFDDPEAFPPEQHGFTRERLSWVHLDDGLPQYEGNSP